MDESGRFRFAKVIPDLFAFVIGLGLAGFLQWETADLVWSLWLCSLVVGYLTILIAIGSGVRIALVAINDSGKSAWLILGTLGFALFLLGFFSLHFCGFHAGHSVFLNVFFPLEGAPKDGFGDAFMNPILLWKLAFQYLIAPYGLFLIPAIIAERENLLAPVLGASRLIREEQEGDGVTKEAGGKAGQNILFRPYINVVRMHILIFFFGLAHALKFDNFLIYAVVYFVYFFPWGYFKKKKKEA